MKTAEWWEDLQIMKLERATFLTNLHFQAGFWNKCNLQNGSTDGFRCSNEKLHFNPDSLGCFTRLQVIFIVYKG